MSSLGKLKKLSVSDMRKIWPSEERDLSPWIKDNIDVLNEVLGLQIEIQTQEESVHSFRLDLAGTDNNSQRPVIIENQFNQSNHDHLGKLITYSAAKEAGIMIWIANKIQLAHKEALDWLNQFTPSEMAFYGIELEVFQIDGSTPAPNFRVVAEPPSFKKKIDTGEISPKNKRYEKFFNTVREKILSIQSTFTRAKALPQSWWSVGAGRSGFSVATAFTETNTLKVEIYIDTGKREYNELALNKLSENRKGIEEKIGNELIYDSIPGSRACRVYLSISGTIDDNEQKLKEYVEWAASLIIKFREVFYPLIKNIKIDA